jgi:CPA1 family monovalent cation:H+ antiporter
MQAVEFLLVLLAATAALGVAAHRLNVPQPVLLVIGGAALAILPGLPPVQLDPDTVFLLFVPPLLYRAASQASLIEFRRRMDGIVFLSFTMVIATMAAVTVTAHAVVPGLPWDAAFVLGAIVSPPDSVAAISLTRGVRLPRRVVTLLRGEGLFNDAAAFVAYRIAVAAMVTGSFSAKDAALGFLAAGALGTGIGLAMGWVIARLRERLRAIPVVENTVSLLTPFAAYLPAERLGASGVLAVVAIGLYLGRWAPHSVAPGTRLQADATWDMIVFLLEGLAFVLVGFALPGAAHLLAHHRPLELAAWGAAVAAAVILTRFVLVLPRSWLGTAWRRWRGEPEPLPLWSHVLLVSWAGVRGGESLVVAMSLPLVTAAGAPLPARDLVIFLTFAVIVTTLLVQGLSMRALPRLLKLRDDVSDDVEEAYARERLRAAGLACVADHERTGALSPGAARDARTLLHLDDPARAAPDLPASVIANQRGELLALLDEGRISDAVMRRLLRELDLRAALLAGP